MTDPGADGRIRDLLRRMGGNAASPLFFGLAEEYRAAGRLPEAIRTLEKGLETHPDYVSARVGLGRAYLAAGRTEEAAEMFARALTLDPGNLVSARTLAEIHLARGDRLEAIKRYKLYLALSGDRSVEEIIARVESEIGPAPPPSSDAQGRVLADLYFEQGHYSEALAAYDGLSRAHPSDASLARHKREAAARLAAAASGTAPSPPAETASSPSPEPNASLREARIGALRRWLGVIQTR